MATDEWITFGDTEMINLSRTAQLAQVMGVDMVWTEPSEVQWIEDAIGFDYNDITQAPWYDPGAPASTEFAGVVPMGFPGMGDSTREASTIEYIGNGGSAGRARNKTLSIVASVALVASTQRGAEFGKRWLDRVLAGNGARQFCSGVDMAFFQYDGNGSSVLPPIEHYRDVTLSRAVSVTRKRTSHCGVLLLATFTLTANDPFVYGLPRPVFNSLGAANPTAPAGYPNLIMSSGSLTMLEQECPNYDYTPLYDPLHPALVAPPTVPDFYPAGWNLPAGQEFMRYWVRLNSLEPSDLNKVPEITITSSVEARMVRVSIWPGPTNAASSCDPLWSAVATYVPPTLQFILDGEQEAAYAWDGGSPSVRRADSLVFGPGARPLDWASLTDPDGLLVTLDVMKKGGGYEGDGTLRMSMSLIPKSD